MAILKLIRILSQLYINASPEGTLLNRGNGIAEIILGFGKMNFEK